MTRAKNQHLKQVLGNTRGQISIFFGVTLITIFSFIAFVVNVGLFVKAKINLQNAVDSAAWSGAASQARQLTNIAHLNWEMRNTYKEWMFKYYVLGQLANENIHTPTGNNMNFGLKRFDSGGSGFSSGIKGDHYNVPSICLHFGSGNENICTIYQVPGLPRFHVAGIPDVSEEFEATMDAFVKLKANNCAVRSTYNFQAARNYAYSSGEAATDIPIAAAGRVGAWIQAMELSLRMRNLESIVNLPPITQGICGRNGPSGCIRPDQLVNENANFGIPLNDRPLKAYLAGLKSIGGGEFKNDQGNSFANTFVLYELEPKKYQTNAQSLSSFLIPPGATHTNGETVLSSKRYLDLIPMVVNFTTFFTTFAPTTEALGTVGVADSSGTAAEASCASTKTALPVPGYILGFYKNPKVITYYAVKGKAKYQGLLNPFFSPFELSAYAAAKPFGGKIGPALTATVNKTDYAQASANRARESEGNGSRTANYVMGFNPSGDPRYTEDENDGKKVQGLPLPSTSSFFLQELDEEAAIGGTPEANSSVKFSIPNLIYNLDSEPGIGDNLPTLSYNQNIDQLNTMAISPGLFAIDQFDAFKRNIPGYVEGAAGVSEQQLAEAFVNVRAPTNYDVLNYLVPTILDLQTPGTEDHFPTAKFYGDGEGTIGYFAPLFHPALLYNDQEVVKSVLQSYIESLSNAVISYREALKFYATKVANTSSQSSGAYAEAANAIYNESIDGDPANTTVTLPIPQCQKQSIASRFTYFLMETEQTDPSPDNCRIVPLLGSIRNYVERKTGNDTEKLFYFTSYRLNNTAGPNSGLTNNTVRSAYSPGKDYGGDESGVSINPLTGREKNHRRNAYSTKLISLRSITENSSGYGINASNYMEAKKGLSPEGTTPTTPLDIKTSGDVIDNILSKDQLSEFGTELYF